MSSNDSYKHSEEDFRFLFEQAADGIFIASADGIYTAVNPSGNRMLGYAPGELVGRHIAQVVRPEELERLETSIHDVLDGEVLTHTWWLRRKDDSLIEVELNAQRLSDGSLMAIVRDLGPRRAMESSARASEDRLKSILETAPDIIMTVDRAGKILFINRTGPPFTPEQVVGTVCFDYVPADARPRVRAALEHVFTTRMIDEYEVLGPPGPDGTRGWASVRAGPLVQGEQVAAAILCATDVSARRRDEERIRELAARLQNIASQVPGIVFQYKVRSDGTACFPYASERIREILQLSPEDVREDAGPACAIVHPADRSAVITSLAASASALSAWQCEMRVCFGDGTVRWLYANALPEREPGGSTLWHGYAHDITARKQAELQKAELEEQLQQAQKVESIGRLAGGIAHDFNNLLTAVMGFTQLALTQVAPDCETASYLAGIQDSAERGAAMTQQLLAFARRRVIHPEVIDLNDVLRRMIEMLRRLVGENLELVLAPASKVACVQVDVGSIEQVVMNLVVNARDAIDGAGCIYLDTKDVTLDREFCRTHPDVAPGEYVVLTVSDTGVGMAPEVLSRVFEPFFTTKPVGKGTGLGLSMCYGIVSQAGGHIHIDSELGRGSTFQVYLPRASPRAAAASVARSPETAGQHASETILFVEDEPLILRVASASLRRLGYRVLTASNALDALELVRSIDEPIHLLVTDVVMPKMAGPELAQRLLELRPALRVLYSSGYTQNAILTDRARGDSVQFLQKPYTPATLARRARELLDQRQ